MVYRENAKPPQSKRTCGNCNFNRKGYCMALPPLFKVVVNRYPGSAPSLQDIGTVSEHSSVAVSNEPCSFWVQKEGTIDVTAEIDREAAAHVAKEFEEALVVAERRGSRTTNVLVDVEKAKKLLRSLNEVLTR